MSQPTAPTSTSLLQYLMGMRDNPRRQVLLHIGEINVHRMVAFTDGYRACQRVHGLLDEEYGLCGPPRRCAHKTRDTVLVLRDRAWRRRESKPLRVVRNSQQNRAHTS
jgi:hypothetical protein